METTVICNSCDKEVVIDDTILKQIDECRQFETGNKLYSIKFYVCKHCCAKQTVQIDNEETNALFSKGLRLLYRGSKTKSSKKRQKIKQEYYLLCKQLEAKRNELALFADGKRFVSADDSIVYKAEVSEVNYAN